MNTISVIEGDNEISPLIESGLMQLGGSLGGVSLAGKNAIAGGLIPDLLVVSSGGGGGAVPAGCGTLLSPSSAPAGEGLLSPRRVVSYGMSPRDSLTLSSIGTGRMVLTLQRELSALNGRLLERQDIPLRTGPGREPDDVLAASAALLLLGAEPSALNSIIL